MQLKQPLKDIARRAYDTGARAYLTPLLRRQADSTRGDELNESALQYALTLQSLAKLGKREVLDVGTGKAAWPGLLFDCGFRVTAIDNYSPYWGWRKPFNRHYLIQDDDVTRSQLTRLFDAVTCLNVMSAIDDDEAAIGGLFRLTKPGGLIILSFPYNEHRSVGDVYRLPGAGYGTDFLFKCRVYCRADIERWVSAQPARVVSQAYLRVFSGELWTMGKRIPPEMTTAEEHHHFTLLVIEKDGADGAATPGT